jgi:hypothetical protein
VINPKKYAHAIGRLNGTLQLLSQRLKETLLNVGKEGHLTSRPETKTIQQDLERIVEYIDKDFPIVGLAPEVCEGPIAQFDQTVRIAAQKLDKTADWSVVTFSVWEIMSIAGVPLALHFGFPVLMSVGGGLTSALIGWGWLNAQWSGAKQFYLKRLERASATLKTDLDKVYFQEVEDSYQRPFNRLTNIYRDSLSRTRRVLLDREALARKNQVAIDQIAREMKL